MERGILYLCATPIGNLGDITSRVVETLKYVDIIACEDTRTSRVLLDHFEIKTPTESYHEHNAASKGEYLISLLLSGKNIALITDAGTPAISDPGERIVASCIENNIEVTSLPGPSALITALSLSGISSKRFSFEGFLPRTKKERREILDELAYEKRTIIIYESPKRVADTLSDLAKLPGDRKIAICRELTKKFEEIDHTTTKAAADTYKSKENIKGEFVLVMEGCPEEELSKRAMEEFETLSIEEHVAMYEKRGYERMEAMKLCAKDRGLSKRDVYKELNS